MTTQPSQNQADNALDAQPVFTAFSEEELASLTRRIIESGQLGRSKTYAALLTYLQRCALENRTPKEIEIALDVLGRNADFDVTRDSVVRVYIHQLRKRLDSYYQRFEKDASWHLVIPKGQYMLAARPGPGSNGKTGSTVKSAQTADRDGQQKSGPVRKRPLSALMLAVCLLLVANLVWLGYITLQTPDTSHALQATEHKLWAAMKDDDLPVLLVMGDYYIFGERDEFGRIDRMVRDFNINSAEELASQQRQNLASSSYLDLNLNYLPEGSAFALSRIVPVLEAAGKRVNVTMMSRLNTADLKTSHIIYIGYISALDKLNSLVFASSGLQIGRTFDELYNRGSGEIYSSDAGLPQQNQPFRDYGLLSTFPAPGGIQVLIVAGNRDAGLMHSAQAAAQASQLDHIESSLKLPYEPDYASYEALYEVFGFDRLNFDANLVYSRELDPSRIWGGELSTQQGLP